jgi:hypothetical protein
LEKVHNGTILPNTCQNLRKNALCCIPQENRQKLENMGKVHYGAFLRKTRRKIRKMHYGASFKNIDKYWKNSKVCTMVQFLGKSAIF